MKKVGLFLTSLGLIFMLAACSSNKLELDEDLFTDGQTLMQQYEKGLNGEDITPDESIATMFQALYDDGDFSSEEEELFVSQVVLLKAQYEAFLAQSGYENYSGDESGDSEDTKEQAIETINEMKDKFGM